MIKISNKKIIIVAITIKLCGRLAQKKYIPFEYLDIFRAKSLLNAYFKGDGNLKKGKWRRFSTSSLQLKNDIFSGLT